MSGPSLLDLEMRLLVARHGREEVSRTLSRIAHVDVAALDSDLRAFESETRKKPRRTRRPRKTANELLAKLDIADLQVRKLMQELGTAYEDRKFLPILRDVRTFLEAKGISTAKIRSRADALAVVLNALSQLSASELRALNEERLDDRGGLGMIADHLLSHRATPT